MSSKVGPDAYGPAAYGTGEKRVISVLLRDSPAANRRTTFAELEARGVDLFMFDLRLQFDEYVE
jgi:hypothetical protein